METLSEKIEREDIPRIILILGSSPSYTDRSLEGKWKDVATELHTPEEVFLTLEFNARQGKVDLLGTVEAVIEDWVARENENATFNKLAGTLMKNGINGDFGELWGSLVYQSDPWNQSQWTRQAAVEPTFMPGMSSRWMPKKGRWENSGALGTGGVSAFGLKHHATTKNISINLSDRLEKRKDRAAVYRGSFKGKPVAVKEIPRGYSALANNEARLLKREAYNHSNIVNILCIEVGANNARYIAMDLFICTLRGWAERQYSMHGIDGVNVLKEVTEGLAYLHGRDIIHQNLMPDNILLKREDGDKGSVRAVISDLGFAKNVRDRDSGHRQSDSDTFERNIGWEAPEAITSSSERSSHKMTTAVDVFSLGCVYYYVLTYMTSNEAHHPFGIPDQRRSNIRGNDPDLAKLQGDTKGAKKLIKKMLSQDPEKRPPTMAIIRHPIFWPNKKLLDFFFAINERIAWGSDLDLPQSIPKFIEDGWLVVGKSWTASIDSNLLSELYKHQEYDGSSVWHLIRAIRNLATHFKRCSKDIKLLLGGTPEQSVHYWTTEFPALLPYTWASFEKQKTGSRSLTVYYDPDFDFGEYFEEVNKIDPRTLKKLKNGEGIDEAIVMFKQKTYDVLDEIKKTKFNSKEAKHQAHRAALMARRDKCQKGVQNMLRSKSIEYESNYLENALLILNAPTDVVISIAEVDQVESIAGNYEFEINLCSGTDDESNPTHSATAPGSSNGRNTYLPDVKQNIEQIQAHKAWQLARDTNGNNNEINGTQQAGNAAPVVAIFDTGVYRDHPALKGNFRETYNWFDPYGPTCDKCRQRATSVYNLRQLSTTCDNCRQRATTEQSERAKYPHGTHVAGIAVGSNGLGVAPNAKWIACLGLPGGRGRSWGIKACAKWIYSPRVETGESTMAPNVVCCPWTCKALDDNSEGLLKRSIENWLDVGIIPVFSMGNDGLRNGVIWLPARMQNVISVGAVDMKDEIAEWSNWGIITDKLMKPNIVAPGVNIYSANDGKGEELYYSYRSGTSQATAHVAGAICVLLERNKDLDCDQIKEILQKTAFRRDGSDEWPNKKYGYGRIDVHRALQHVINQHSL